MRLTTATLASTIAIGLLAGPLHVEAQESAKVPRSGYLSYYPHEEHKLLAAFKEGVRICGVELMVNLKTAKALGITIPSSILFRADNVIR